jgi:hypothetical protein
MYVYGEKKNRESLQNALILSSDRSEQDTVEAIYYELHKVKVEGQ